MLVKIGVNKLDLTDNWKAESYKERLIGASLEIC